MPVNTLNNVMGGEIVIYQSAAGGPRLDVRVEKDTIWLDAHQMAELFERDRTVIVRHIRNVYATGELAPEATCAKNAQVAADGKIRQMDLYNLDMILSVGYRVNSRRGTQFRIWATNVLRGHLVRGYTANERRLAELRQSLRLVEHALTGDAVSAEEATALLRVVTDYAYALDLLDDYDHQRVAAEATGTGLAVGIGYARRAGSSANCAKSSARPPCSGWRRTRACTARSTRSCRPSTDTTFTPAWRKRPRTCSISW